jgi:FkbH-like protein
MLREMTAAAVDTDEVLMLSALRRRASRNGLIQSQRTVRIALLGGYTLYPLNELIGHLLEVGRPDSCTPEFLLGGYDNYVSEILEPTSSVYEFNPAVIVLVPPLRHCRYGGGLLDGRPEQEQQGNALALQILELCQTANARTGAEIILANFPLPARFDPGACRTRTLGSDWNFRKFVNLELGLNAPPYVHICDVEFLSARRGTPEAFDARAWFESKQPYGRNLLLDVANEAVFLIQSLRHGPKKVAVLDLDGTLWGGVIGEDGLSGIEIGDTSPRGAAFKAFQQYLLSLNQRGILLAVCSKNDYDIAVEPFENHPEMVLRMGNIASFRANWQPKSENLREIASELNLGLDSLVFIDDNPAEIEIVRQFAPEVSTVLLGADPAEHVATLADARLFEQRSITHDDLQRANRYEVDQRRSTLLTSVTDMCAYLESLQMEAVMLEFRSVDVARISQLINKSNQFNLTTHRRSEGEVQAVMNDPSFFHFTTRLKDRFGEHGLIGVVVGQVVRETAYIDTWLMSCRVLKRQVEEEVLNEIVRLASFHKCTSIRGVYRPTAKNGMVRDHYRTFGFTPILEREDRLEFELDPRLYQHRSTTIRVIEEPYDSNSGNRQAAAYF